MQGVWAWEDSHSALHSQSVSGCWMSEVVSEEWCQVLLLPQLWASHGSDAVVVPPPPSRHLQEERVSRIGDPVETD